MLGTIKDRIKSGHQYVIEWFDGSENEQIEEHLFGSFTRRDRHRIDDYVLAMDKNDSLYKPAKMTLISDDRKTVTVQFIDLDKNPSSRFDHFC
jgi:hypothetical protein